MNNPMWIIFKLKTVFIGFVPFTLFCVKRSCQGNSLLPTEITIFWTKMSFFFVNICQKCFTPENLGLYVSQFELEMFSALFVRFKVFDEKKSFPLYLSSFLRESRFEKLRFALACF